MLTGFIFLEFVFFQQENIQTKQTRIAATKDITRKGRNSTGMSVLGVPQIVSKIATKVQ
jgi:hypothetical protein